MVVCPGPSFARPPLRVIPPSRDPLGGTPPVRPSLRGTFFCWTHSAGPLLRGPPLRRTAQNFAFFPLPPPFSPFLSLSGGLLVSFFSLRVSSRVFFPLSGGLLVEFWWCFGRSGPQMCLFSPSGCPVKPRRPPPFRVSPFQPHRPSCPQPFGPPPLLYIWIPTPSLLPSWPLPIPSPSPSPPPPHPRNAQN